MDLLQFEFQNGEPGSYSYNLGQLIKKLRYFRNVSLDQFQAAAPELKQIEKELQDFDSLLGDPKRFYIDELMEELNNEN